VVGVEVELQVSAGGYHRDLRIAFAAVVDEPHPALLRRSFPVARVAHLALPAKPAEELVALEL